MKIFAKTTWRALAIAPLAAFAATTDPMGGIVVNCPDSSDTRIALPFYRPPVFEGVVNSYSGNVITFSGTPGFAADQFVYEEGVQSNTYFVLVMSGEVDGEGQPAGASLEGSIFAITGNATDSVTVDLNGGSLSGLQQASVDASGDIVQIIPYWTLNTLFPEGEGFAASSTFTPSAVFMFPDMASAGTDLSTSDIFFYYSGVAAGGEGWRRSGSSPLTKFDDQVLTNEISYIVRNNSGSAFDVMISGSVPMAAYRTPLNTLAADVPQDNAIALNFPVDTTLSESQLFESGAFEGSATFTPADILLVYDNAAVGQNKSSSEVYFYYTGLAAGGPGWRKQGDSPLTIHDNEPVFSAGKGFVIRKGAQPAPQSSIWTAAPPYTVQAQP